MSRHLALNAAGHLAQIIAGLLAVPWLIGALGEFRFGLFALVLVLAGYLGIFDLGFGRALTKLVAEASGRHDSRATGVLVRTGVVVLGLLGLAASALTLLTAPALMRVGLSLSPDEMLEVRAAIPWLAACLPFAIGIPALTGVFEAQMRFDVSASARALGGTVTALLPVAATQYEPSLAAAVMGLCLARALTYVALLALSLRLVPEVIGRPIISGQSVSALLVFGGWLTVTNLVGPLMASLDRFAVGRWASIVTVAYYAAPYEALTRLWIVPEAVLGVAFPALSRATGRPSEQLRLVDQTMRWVLLVMVPATGAALVLAPELLAGWLGEAFARHGGTPARWLAAGVLANAAARVPFVLLQAIGRPDLPARVHLAQVAPFLFALWAGTTAAGASGAAMVWTARMVVDLLILSWLASRHLPGSGALMRRACLLIAGALGVSTLVVLVPGAPARGGLLAGALLAWAVFGWLRVLTAEERGYLTRRSV